MSGPSGKFLPSLPFSGAIPAPLSVSGRYPAVIRLAGAMPGFTPSSQGDWEAFAASETGFEAWLMLAGELLASDASIAAYTGSVIFRGESLMGASSAASFEADVIGATVIIDGDWSDVADSAWQAVGTALRFATLSLEATSSQSITADVIEPSVYVEGAMTASSTATAQLAAGLLLSASTSASGDSVWEASGLRLVFGQAEASASSDVSAVGSFILRGTWAAESTSSGAFSGSGILRGGLEASATSSESLAGDVIPGNQLVDGELTANATSQGDWAGMLRLFGAVSVNSASSSTVTGDVILAPVEPEAIVPVTQIAVTNMTGAVTDIDDDPDAPDGLWYTANTVESTALTVRMGTPGLDPSGTANQAFKVLVRRNATGGNNPTVTIEILIGSSVISTVASNASLAADTVYSQSINASLITNKADVQVRVTGSRSGGATNQRRTVEVGAIRWIASTT